MFPAEVFKYHDSQNIKFILWGTCLFRVHAQTEDTAFLKVHYHLSEDVIVFDSQRKPVGELLPDESKVIAKLPRKVVEYRDDIDEQSQPIAVIGEQHHREVAKQLFDLNPELGEVALVGVLGTRKINELQDAQKHQEPSNQLQFHEMPSRVARPHTEIHPSK